MLKQHAINSSMIHTTAAQAADLAVSIDSQLAELDLQLLGNLTAKDVRSILAGIRLDMVDLRYLAASTKSLSMLY